jgi:hypothetical protein
VKRSYVAALLMLACAIPAFGQDKTFCKAFFQVLRADTESPEHLRAGMSGSEKRWWENEGQKRYPGLCLDGSVSSGDKPRYVVIISPSGSLGDSAVTPDEVYGLPASAIQSTAPKEWIYEPRWDMASISILTVSYDGQPRPTCGSHGRRRSHLGMVVAERHQSPAGRYSIPFQGAGVLRRDVLIRAGLALSGLRPTQPAPTR